MRVAVIGANGQLGCDVSKAFAENGHDVIHLNHDVMDVADLDGSMANLTKAGPDVIVNTAAMHNVEACEDEQRLQPQDAPGPCGEHHVQERGR